jgi:DNA-binding IclR family transcriptional regulator
MTPSSAREGYHVSRTLGALDLLADAPRTVTQVAEALAVHSRTARRLLNRLVYDGYARCIPGRRPTYELTPRFAALAARALDQRVSRAEPAGQGSG